MADDIDIANDKAQTLLDYRIQEARRAHSVERDGYCKNPGCGEKAVGLYCSDECKDDHRRIEAIRAKQFKS